MSLNFNVGKVNGNPSTDSPAQKKFATLMGIEQIPYFLICSAAARAAASAFFPLRPFDFEPIPVSSTEMSILHYVLRFIWLTCVQCITALHITLFLQLTN